MIRVQIKVIYPEDYQLPKETEKMLKREKEKIERDLTARLLES